MLNDGVHLVVVAEDEEFVPELFAAGFDAREGFGFGALVVGIADGGLPEHWGIIGWKKG
mgnify:CR=1 FL=1